jgi:hypothetical protein
MNILPKILSGKDTLLIFVWTVVGMISGVLLVWFFKPSKVIIGVFVDMGLLLGIIVPMVWIARRNGLSAHSLGFTPIKISWMFVGIGLGFVVLVAGGFVSSMIADFLGISRGFDFLTIRRLFDGPPWLTFVSMKLFWGILIPIAEETLFRGVLFRYLRQNHAFLPSLISSSMIFSALHMEASLFPFTFLLGCATAWIYEKSGSLYSAYLVHIAVNSLAANFFLLSLFS